MKIGTNLGYSPSFYVYYIFRLLSVFLFSGFEGQSPEITNIVDIRGESNREIVMRISSDIKSQNRFYSDLNGYQVCYIDNRAKNHKVRLIKAHLSTCLLIFPAIQSAS